jgi:hypothetical protein
MSSHIILDNYTPTYQNSIDFSVGITDGKEFDNGVHSASWVQLRSYLIEK